MGFTRKYIKERQFVLTLVRDGANDELLKEHVMLLTAETKDIHPFVELADASELHDLSSFTEIGVLVSGSSEVDRKPYKNDKLAILVSSDDAYKLATRYEASSIYYRYGVNVFRDFQEAIEWLGVADLEDEINILRNE